MTVRTVREKGAVRPLRGHLEAYAIMDLRRCRPWLPRVQNRTSWLSESKNQQNGNQLKHIEIMDCLFGCPVHMYIRITFEFAPQDTIYLRHKDRHKDPLKPSQRNR